MKRHLGALCLIAFAALGVGLLRIGLPDPLTERLESALLDLRFRLRGPVEPPGELIIIKVDETSLARYRSLTETRFALAQAVDRIASDGARAIAMDLLMPEPTAADRVLAAALARSDRAILAGASVTASGASRDDALEPEQAAALSRSLFPLVIGEAGDAPAADRTDGNFLMPHPGIALSGVIGHTNILRSPDRVARQAVLALPVAEGFLPSLPVATYAVAWGLAPGETVIWPGRQIRLGERVFEIDAEGRTTINHYGPSGSIPAVSLVDLAAGRVPPDSLKGRIVLIGATAESLRDVFASSFASDVAGVEILATITGNLIDGSFIRRNDAALLATLVLGVAGALFAYAAALPHAPLRAVAGTSLVWVACLGTAFAAFASGGLWLDATTLIAALAIGTGAGGVARDREERERIARLGRERANIARFLPTALAEEIARGGRPSFDRRSLRAAVLFVDLEGYTARSETEDPLAVAEFLARLHAFFEATAVAHGGVVIDFAGDGALIVFGLPEPSPDDAAAAIACGEALVAGVGALPSPEDSLRLRVSIHYGPVAAAVLGGARQAHATITGDTVNLASRLQDTAKAHRAAIVVTRAALDAAGRLDPSGEGDYTFLVEEVPRGRRQSIEVWTRKELPVQAFHENPSPERASPPGGGRSGL